MTEGLFELGFFAALILMLAAIVVNGGGVAPYSGPSVWVWTAGVLALGVWIGRRSAA